MDEDVIGKKPVHEIGVGLDDLSIDELKERIALLREEIARLENAIEIKDRSRTAADSVFKF